MKKDIYYKYLRSPLKIALLYFLKSFSEWERKVLVLETSKRFLNQ